MMKNMYYDYYQSPVGTLLLAGTEQELCLISFPQGKMARQPKPNWQHKPEYFSICKQQLTEYFAGQRKAFDLAYQIQGTEFQQTVLRQVAKVPFGQTASYSIIAAAINNPKAVRAVGTANATNNLPIIIPCHRIIGKNGSLTGFGGGLPTKEFLLALEGIKLPKQQCAKLM